VSASRRGFLAALAVSTTASACSNSTGSVPTSRRGAAPPASPSRLAASTPSDPSAAPTPSTPSREPRGDLVHGPRSVPAVALTFHGAGDPALCRRALRAFAGAGAHATVMAVGTWLQQNPELAGAVVAAGHELGNHTWTHLPMRRLSAEEDRREVERAARLLEHLTGSRGRWFRPSGTPRSTARIRAAAAQSGYPRCLAYDVDPLDYTDPGADTVTRRVLAAVRPGSIVSLHLGHPGTVAALPRLLDGLAQRGLQPVTMTTLVGAR
jgi:peptidoglycan/xylan/chitin deacetylase (PgdA/CDA1 family)